MPTETYYKTGLPVELIKLRAIVLALGERADPPWWKTKIMRGIGFRFLERIYPRSYFWAAINTAGKAACDVHDLSVGRVGVYHLFRFPAGLEIDVHNCFYDLNKKITDEIIGLCDNEDWLIGKLKDLCNGQTTKNFIPGAIKIGNEHDCYKTEILKITASLYLSAFESGKQIFPYFISEMNS